MEEFQFEMDREEDQDLFGSPFRFRRVFHGQAAGLTRQDSNSTISFPSPVKSKSNRMQIDEILPEYYRQQEYFRQQLRGGTPDDEPPDIDPMLPPNEPRDQFMEETLQDIQPEESSYEQQTSPENTAEYMQEYIKYQESLINNLLNIIANLEKKETDRGQIVKYSPGLDVPVDESPTVHDQGYDLEYREAVEQDKQALLKQIQSLGKSYEKQISRMMTDYAALVQQVESLGRFSNATRNEWFCTLFKINL